MFALYKIILKENYIKEIILKAIILNQRNVRIRFLMQTKIQWRYFLKSFNSYQKIILDWTRINEIWRLSKIACIAKELVFLYMWRHSHGLYSHGPKLWTNERAWLWFSQFFQTTHLTAGELVLSDHLTWPYFRPVRWICLVTLLSKFHCLLVVFQVKVSIRLMTFNWTLELRFWTVFGMKQKCKDEVLDGSLVVLTLKHCNSEVFPLLSYSLKQKQQVDSINLVLVLIRLDKTVVRHFPGFENELHEL